MAVVWMIMCILYLPLLFCLNLFTASLPTDTGKLHICVSLGCSYMHRPVHFLSFFVFVDCNCFRLYPKAAVDGVILGHLEVKQNGRWEPVCEDEWRVNGSPIEVCRQFGYNGSISALGVTANDMRCNRSRARLAVCSCPGAGIMDCSHCEDAGTVCEGIHGRPVQLTHM